NTACSSPRRPTPVESSRRGCLPTTRKRTPGGRSSPPTRSRPPGTGSAGCSCATTPTTSASSPRSTTAFTDSATCPPGETGNGVPTAPGVLPVPLSCISTKWSPKGRSTESRGNYDQVRRPCPVFSCGAGRPGASPCTEAAWQGTRRPEPGRIDQTRSSHQAQAGREQVATDSLGHGRQRRTAAGQGRGAAAVALDDPG